MTQLNINIPDSFWEEEVRDGYLVSAKMKKVWAVELDLLNEFIHVCESNGLRYFVAFGTLLGTVRHKGFIPWDDDVDVIMPREDYDKLLKIGNQAFTFPYFFQTPITEHGRFFRTHPQLRNSLTTGAIDGDVHKNINRGIFLDIFVLDEVLHDKIDSHRKELNRIKQIGLQTSAYPDFACNWLKKIKRLLKWIFYKLFYNPQKCFELFQKESSRYQKQGCSLLAHTALLYQDSAIWDKSDWSGYIMMPFEFLHVRVPTNYHEVLTKHYGDYMKPHKSKGNLHGDILLDPETPYSEICQ